MRVLIPSTREPAWNVGTIVQLDPDDPEAYWQFWSDIWAAGESAIVVEHDITPTIEAIQDLTVCSGLWCTQPYPYQGRNFHGLGCVKFSAELMAQTPSLWESVAKMSDRKHPPKHWCRLDAWSYRALTSIGFKRCQHSLSVHHPERRGSAHGCC